MEKQRITGWFSGEIKGMRGARIAPESNQDDIRLCSEEMHRECSTQEQFCQLESRAAWNGGNWDAREYLGLKGSGENLTPKQRDKIWTKCKKRLALCRKVFIEFGEL